MYKEGVSDGIEQGIKQGIDQGIKQGLNERNMEIAKNMKDSKYSFEEISKITGLSINEIEIL